jgi:hypothetical protein
MSQLTQTGPHTANGWLIVAEGQQSLHGRDVACNTILFGEPMSINVLAAPTNLDPPTAESFYDSMSSIGVATVTQRDGGLWIEARFDDAVPAGVFISGDWRAQREDIHYSLWSRFRYRLRYRGLQTWRKPGPRPTSRQTGKWLLVGLAAVQATGFTLAP